MGNIKVDKATLALKGKRYDEAEDIFMNLAEEEYSVEALVWSWYM